jgi:hypothetical protein
MEKKEEITRQTHVMVIPFPATGHMNPMLQFAKRLVSRGLKVTLVAAFIDPDHLINNIQTKQGHDHDLITVETIPDEPATDNDTGTHPTDPVDAYFLRFQKVVSLRLQQLILKHQQNNPNNKITCLVYDSLMPWVLDIAKHLGIFAAPFFTQSNAVNAIYYSVHQRILSVPVEDPSISISLVALPTLQICDLPSFVYDQLSYPSSLRHMIHQCSDFTRADWIFFNTFDSLEEEVVKWMSSQWPIKNIGPTIPSIYLDKRLEDDRDYGLSLFKPQVETCRKWLDSKDMGSVVYVSFGSLATLREEQMEELAWGLKMSKSYFLWVVRDAEMKKLPINFLQETVEQGHLVVTWCSQLQVLSHKAVGCFVTHCGWNSTLEALSLGVPMVAVPQWTDQTTNAKFVMDVWGVGIRVKVDPKGFFTREDIEMCISQVMHGERGLEIKQKSAKWKKLAKEAVDDGGSSDNNIQEFVAQLTSTTHLML